MVFLDTCIWRVGTGEIVAECEVKIVKTDLGEKLNIGHGKKKVSAGMVAWSPDGQ